MPFELHIALRYLLARRKQAFISVISLISTLGVMVGVMALVIALALMTGLQQELRDRILGSNPHVYVWNTGGIDDYHAEAAKLRQLPHVIGAAPEILGQGLISAGRETQPIQINTGKGWFIDEPVVPVSSPLGPPGAAIQRVTPALAAADGLDGILLGRTWPPSLCHDRRHRVAAHASGTLSPMGMIRGPGVCASPASSASGCEFDSSYGFVSLDVAKRLFDKDQVDLIQLRVDDLYLAPQIAQAIPTRLGEQYVTQNWAEMNRSLFSALWLEKMAISLTIGLIVMVAALNIVASLILLVMEKNRDIAILKTMGASARSVTAIFMMQGLIIGIVGTTVGAGVGYLLAFVLDRYKVIRVPIDVYQVSHVPFTVLPLDFALVVIAAVLVCFVATIYPSRQAARLDPAQALRYE
jgi:lipoprotein-releasing system permease protein